MTYLIISLILLAILFFIIPEYGCGCLGLIILVLIVIIVSRVFPNLFLILNQLISAWQWQQPLELLKGIF
ncbi:hypothetical protein AWH48_15835 [Domibacillus aminovorans]|uniref:Uncharacterized protein n=1 Tax=Domibacillus aminovorans TaxID=29332 RepID=A0A177L1E3_9BACI|nr:hypothetical protein AWH48_15835 [Domibacillus aminovorans]